MIGVSEATKTVYYTHELYLRHRHVFHQIHPDYRHVVRVVARTRWVNCDGCDTPTVCKQNRTCFGPLHDELEAS